jgi:hypothetical protein
MADAQGLLRLPQALTVGQYSEVGRSVQVSTAAGRTVVCRLTLDENTPNASWSRADEFSDSRRMSCSLYS